MPRRTYALLTIAWLALPACGETGPEGNLGPWIGEWIQINFLSVDDGGIWDEDDLSGIGFVMEITEAEWTETDDFGHGCSISFSYSMSGGNRYSKKATAAGPGCTVPPALLEFTETGRLEFSGDNRFMIQWFDLVPGDEIVAFKWVRR